MTRWVDTVERIIPAPPAAIFALVADPSRHQDIDGSGTVRAATEPSRQLALHDSFGMNMEFGGPYTMTSTVIELEPDRRIAWQSRPSAESRRWRHIFFGGRIWRYELEPVDGGTRVRESWDLTEEKLKALVWGYRRKTHANMTATLERIERIIAG